MSTLYQYHPLQGDSVKIRILHLVQNVGEEELICQIEHVDVDKAKFTALSYVWGNPGKPHHIQVRDGDGRDIGIVPLTVNIKAQTLWIDQICINQQDNKERGHQVELMSKVYSLAEEVITYTGTEKPGDFAAFALARRIYEHYESVSDEILNDRAQSMNLYRLGQKLLPVKPFLVDEKSVAWRSLCSILEDEWTRRLWMVQERVLNEQILLLRGQLTIRLRFMHTIAVLYLYQAFGKLYSDSNCFSRHCIVHLHQFMPETETRDLETLLRIGWDYECSDERDYVYALLGMSDDAGIFEISPNYSADPHVFCVETAFKIVSKSRGLFAWSTIAPISLRSPQIPSWACFLDIKGMKSNSLSTLLNGMACPYLQQEVLLDPATNILQLTGVSVDSVKERLGVFYTTLPWMYKEMDDEISKRFLATIERARVQLRGNKNIDAIIYRTIVGNVHAIKKVQSTASEFQLGEALGLLLNRLISKSDKPWAKVRTKTRELWEALSNIIHNHGGFKHIESLLWQLLDDESIRNRSLCITTNGKLLLGPLDAEPGDQIKSFLGGINLDVLRPVEDGKYLFVGDGFIDGYMDNELYENDEWKEKVEQFQLV
jgi:hypothetical protein